MVYYTTLTNAALAKISAALAAGTMLTMSEMAVGDGNGTTPYRRRQIATKSATNVAPNKELYEVYPIQALDR